MTAPQYVALILAKVEAFYTVRKQIISTIFISQKSVFLQKRKFILTKTPVCFIISAKGRVGVFSERKLKKGGKYEKG